MLIDILRKALLFNFIFFIIIKPSIEHLLADSIIPYLNQLFSETSVVNFGYVTDNLIIIINNQEFFYSLPFNEYYIIFLVTFFPYFFMKKYIHFHLLNFYLIILTPLIYIFIIYDFVYMLKIIEVSQETINFYFMLNVFLIINKNYNNTHYQLLK